MKRLACLNRASLMLLLTLVGSLTLTTGSAWAQPEDGERGERFRQRWENMSEEERAQMRERMEQRMQERRQEQANRVKEELGVSDEEFQVLQPRIEKIQTLQRERQFAGRTGGGRRGGEGRQAGGPGGGFGGPAFELSEQGQALQAASQKLRETLDDENASADAVKSALTAVREARIAIDGQIATAQDELRALLTARQEASLVVAGVLE